jgi:flavorubredoxin
LGSLLVFVALVISPISIEGVKVVPYNMMVADISHIARELVDASAAVVGWTSIATV